MTALNTALSGIQAGIELYNATAHNTANVNTEGFKRQDATLSEVKGGGVTVLIGESKVSAKDPTYKVQGNKAVERSNIDLVEEGVGAIIAEYQVKANIEAFKAASEMEDSIFEIMA